jgi:hypothetical protein
MGIKESLKNRIERNAIKSTLTYEKRNGELETEEVLIKRSNFPLIGDWQRIYPPLNEDGSTNYTNLIFGGKKNLIKLILVLIVVGLFLYGAYDILHQSKVLMENPCVLNCMKLSP